ncbi:MAG: hypothetical protein ACXVUE_07805 [Solirubrobacteraceae bacterium]
MRLHRGTSALAALATTAAILGSGTPIASARGIIAGGGGGNGGQPVVASSHPANNSTDWGLVGVSAAGGAVLTAAGMTAARRRGHGTPSPSATSVS